MVKQVFSRIDYLSLNTKDIKNHIRSKSRTELAATDNYVNAPQLERITWLPSTSNQLAVSRNKIGKSLLKNQRNDFLLDDPLMHRTRFFVEYHRLHDPGLKRYFESPPIRNRMRKQCFVSVGNDAVCSTREFIDYIRYLERLRSMNHLDSLKHLQKLKIDKQKNFTKCINLNSKKRNTNQLTTSQK